MGNMIEVGEYVRTTDGKIGTFVRYSSRKAESLYKSPADCFIKLGGRKSNLQCFRDYIVKHSKQLIDLIEIGDIVNGYKVSDKNGTLLCTNIKGIDRSGYHIPISQYGDGIETILTKEQYQANCYKVGGEEC
jgi:hypothetical protein